MATPFQTCGRQRGFPARLAEGHEPVCALCDKNIDRVGQKKNISMALVCRLFRVFINIMSGTRFLMFTNNPV